MTPTMMKTRRMTVKEAAAANAAQAWFYDEQHVNECSIEDAIQQDDENVFVLVSLAWGGKSDGSGEQTGKTVARVCFDPDDLEHGLDGWFVFNADDMDFSTFDRLRRKTYGPTL